MAENGRGLGKCELNHVGSYGYPTRPEEPYPFCPQCGKEMVWRCKACEAPLPDESEELAGARYCRQCGAGYFGQAEPGQE